MEACFSWQRSSRERDLAGKVTCWGVTAPLKAGTPYRSTTTQQHHSHSHSTAAPPSPATKRSPMPPRKKRVRPPPGTLPRSLPFRGAPGDTTFTQLPSDVLGVIYSLCSGPDKRALYSTCRATRSSPAIRSMIRSLTSPSAGALASFPGDLLERLVFPRAYGQDSVLRFLQSAPSVPGAQQRLEQTTTVEMKVRALCAGGARHARARRELLSLCCMPFNIQLHACRLRHTAAAAVRLWWCVRAASCCAAMPCALCASPAACCARAATACAGR